MPRNPMQFAKNHKAWAIGEHLAGQFKVRRVVWGRLLAREEKRKGEHVRAALVMVRRTTK